MVEDKETLFAWLANALKDSPVDFLEVFNNCAVFMFEGIFEDTIEN
jgi:hypothetical protein